MCTILKLHEYEGINLVKMRRIVLERPRKYYK